MSLGIPNCVLDELMEGDKRDIVGDLWDRYSREDKLYHILYNFALCISENDGVIANVRSEAANIIELLDDEDKDE